MKVGDLVKFRFIYNGCSLNGKRAMYLGEDIIKRSDGAIIVNHKVLEIGVSRPTIVDRTVLKYMEVLDESR